MIRRFSLHNAAALAIATALVAVPAAAQDVAPIVDESGDGTITSARDIVVLGSVGYRNRSEDQAEPVISYDSEYFQRFEPLTAGDALKRVPSVTFLSDVIESDGARLRGLPPGYTQILINGEKVPGSNADRSFFLDRIPAELIDRVEIVRSSSARRTGDAVAGTLNIKLRDGYELDGGYLRAGGLYYDDKELEPSIGGVFGGALGPGRFLIGGNFQGRHNPKKKYSLRYSDSPENNPNFATDDFDNREDQTDTRDGKDYSFNATYDIKGDTTDFSLSGFYVHTDRTETERSFEYNHPTNINGPVRATPPGNLTVDNANVAKINQDNYSVNGKLAHRWSAGETSLKIGYAWFDEDRFETEYEVEFDRALPRFTGDQTRTGITDKEFSVRLEHEFELGENTKLLFGGLWQDKDRDTSITEAPRDRYNLTAANRQGYDQFSRNPTEFVRTFGAFVPAVGGINTIEEKRLDGFVLIEGDMPGVKWEAGVRYETTDLTIDDLTPPGTRIDNDYEKLLPSASVKIDVGARGRVTASVARTSRRPEFNFLSPATLEEELGDNDLLGNPLLDPETAWGFDLGYEHRLGRSGIAGINVFYRKVEDLIELTNTGPIVGRPGAFTYQPQNIGDGKVWGVEFDLSTDLGFIGLPDTGVFGNVSWLDSKIVDEFGERRFNGQSKYVYNFGAIQDIPSIGAAFGATYRKQGGAFDRTVGEEVFTSYGADLEIFVEKRFGKSFTIRAVGSNLLNGAKRETFNKFTTIADQKDRSFDEYELESEKAGPVFQLMARYAF
ncbi:TonB-dependent receptor plug domain-containing protein [Sphingopyxis sp.]|jgi:outer membrane receptor protein involved in Fe transport|uniref:TonB-dependent receptor plug domain-containing protein n=1 Tax=Sphingopyxis sp. TaxID=1908224 RepID=UPI002E0AE819|nr:TonB-dependent receptor [Sphingopyxis sp.]